MTLKLAESNVMLHCIAECLELTDSSALEEQQKPCFYNYKSGAGFKN